jgi:hypothetical protein
MATFAHLLEHNCISLYCFGLVLSIPKMVMCIQLQSFISLLNKTEMDKMSYLPKYVMKRMVPENALKQVSGGVEITIVNQVATLPVDAIPGNPASFFTVKLNGKQLPHSDMEKIIITVDGKPYTLPKIQEATEIPTGATLKFFFPLKGAKAGEDLKIELHVPEINADIELIRKIN